MLLAFVYCLLTILAALFVDHLLGEPKHCHPLIKFGQVANFIEKRLNTTALNSRSANITLQLQGTLAWVLTVCPWVVLTVVIVTLTDYVPPRGVASISLWLVECFILYLGIGRKSLKQHVEAIANKLISEDLQAARTACAMIVSRDTTNSNETEIASAAIESSLENSCDGIYGAIFWFALLGAPGVVLYRLSNTLDAMWGYRSEHFAHFGKFSARIDDLLNFIPARITALTFALLSPDPLQTLKNWRQQAPQLSSPNGGPVMICGATALDLEVGGPAVYHGKLTHKPYFGGSRKPGAHDIAMAISLNDKALIFWVIIAAVLHSLTSRHLMF